jgi:hypothetical protein
MDFQEILKSKPNNPHYLNRYIKFIIWCLKNNDTSNGYFEKHHICPRASDMFPEYSNFNDNPWNSVLLTFRQHLLAHVLLWKAYGGSQTYALEYMLNIQNINTNYSKHRKIPFSYDIRYAEKLKKEKHLLLKDTAVYKDADGNKFRLKVNDPKIQELNLVGNNMGITLPNSAKEKMRLAKEKYKSGKLYKGVESKRVKINSPDYQKLIDSGWSTVKTQDIIDQINTKRYQIVSNKLKGTTTYYYPNGEYYGRISNDDPNIKTLGLIHIHSDKQKKQNLDRSKLAIKANLNTEYWNNGIECKKFKVGQETPEGWVKGILRDQASISEKCKLANSGKVYWNNGIECKKFQIGENPGEGWKQGMLPRK